MSHRTIHNDALYAHFVTFSCYRRRNLLDHPAPRRIITETLSEQLGRLDGRCLGFVIMPNHVHSILWFPAVSRISELMKQWKRTSSYRLKNQLQDIPAYASLLGVDDPIWQPRFYDFPIGNEKILQEKIDYMHSNPVRAGLVTKAEEWPDSSARFYFLAERSIIPIGLENVHYVAKENEEV